MKGVKFISSYIELIIYRQVSRAYQKVTKISKSLFVLLYLYCLGAYVIYVHVSLFARSPVLPERLSHYIYIYIYTYCQFKLTQSVSNVRLDCGSVYITIAQVSNCPIPSYGQNYSRAYATNCDS